MAMDVEGLLGFPYWKSALRKFTPDSPFFASGNIEREILAKQVALDLTENEKQELEDMEVEGRKIFCPIVGCGASLDSLMGFENHYNARHSAVCSVCSRTYPTLRLLSMHVSEVHDSFFQAKVAKGFAMYECLVESCGLKFKSYKSRQQHLVDKHQFPISFEFYKKAHLSKKQRQRFQCKQAPYRKEDTSNSKADAMLLGDETLNGLVTAVSKLSTSDSTPSSISFGRRHSRGLAFVPRAVQRERKAESSSTATKR
ncbi:hypothetical protein Nepgr_008693 [Nepenthes gracilis]|uniref:C2H2-type domain-containing protein n=1 Tax=Nepenthes gracilis TaxID=150966 RepID=A0AAD3XJH7_NEPGR|nr:hypothetical protein Nepgr_008693 [Nepenthes gracilis]